MTRINLLPWREEQRQKRQRHFIAMLLMALILGVVLILLAGSVYDQKINHQQSRNELVKLEIHKLDARIKRINELEAVRARLISRKQIIERLQASRSMTVELLDNLAKSIPAGITLANITQLGPNLTLAGSSQSNARVSAYLRNLELNELFLNPQLDFVKSEPTPGSNSEPYQFSVRVSLRPPKTTDDEFGTDGQQDQGGLE